ncbi:MAG: hypothetical protein QG597_2168 [Actinomycetota bacterium]|nr:hypothetical protein [Actinomycetota bacterium]
MRGDNAHMHVLTPGPGPDLTDDDLLRLYAWPTDRLFLRANMVTTIDGAVQGPDGVSSSISNEADRRVFLLLRHTSDAVIIGAGTVATEGVGPIPVPEHRRDLRAARGQLPRPPLVVVSNRASLPPTAPAFTGPHGRTTVMVVPESAPADRVTTLRDVCDVLVIGGDTVDLAAMLVALADRGLTRLLTEGGPVLLAALMGHVDEICLTTVPTVQGAIAGQPARPAPDLLAGRPVTATAPRLGHLIVAQDTLLASWRFQPPEQADTMGDVGRNRVHSPHEEAPMTGTDDVKAKATDAAADVKAKAEEVVEKVKEVVADVTHKHADKPAAAVKTTTDFVDSKTGGKTAPVSDKVNQAAQAATGAVKAVVPEPASDAPAADAGTEA